MAQKSRNLIVKLDGNRLMGLRSKSIVVSNEFVDITNDVEEWRMGLGNAGGRVVSIQGSGIFKDDTAVNAFEDLAFNGDSANMLIQFENGDYLEGKFLVTSMVYSGEHYGIQQYSINLDSVANDTVTFTRA